MQFSGFDLHFLNFDISRRPVLSPQVTVHSPTWVKRDKQTSQQCKYIRLKSLKRLLLQVSFCHFKNVFFTLCLYVMLWKCDMISRGDGFMLKTWNQTMLYWGTSFLVVCVGCHPFRFSKVWSLRATGLGWGSWRRFTSSLAMEPWPEDTVLVDH